MNPDSSSRPVVGLQRILELTATILLGFVLSLLMSFFLLGNGKIDQVSSLSPCRLSDVSASLQWCDRAELASQVCAEVKGAACYVFSRLLSATYLCVESESESGSEYTEPFFSLGDGTRFAVSGSFQKVSAHLFADTLRTRHSANRKKLILNKSMT